ncbi:MAG: hypothetical protein GF398_00040, partial [Chitinivibrionales bacterium]|nr:hypothetical protein [Chitinivibrionales bacterium]
MRLLHVLSACLLLFAALLPASAAEQSKLYQQWKQSPESAVLPDFSHAGFGDGRMLVPEINENEMPIFDVADYGALPNDNIDDGHAIQAAIDAAAFAGGGIVKLHAGTYRLLDNADGDDNIEPIYLRSSGIIIRGAGSGEGGTLLKCINAFRGQIAPFTGYALFFIGAPNWKGYELVYGYNASVEPVKNTWMGAQGF